MESSQFSHYMIGFGLFIVLCISIANLVMIIKMKKKEGFLGASNTVFSEGAKTGVFSYVNQDRNVLASQTCNLPPDFNAKYIPYCETLPDLGEKTKCYFQCVGSFPGGIRGKCYPKILETYNDYSRQYNKPYFPQITPAECDQDDPCCHGDLNTKMSVFDFLHYNLY